MKSFLQVLFFLFAAAFTANSQRICGTTEYTQQLLKADPSLKQVFKNIEKQIISFDGNLHSNIAKRDTISNEVIYIPVVVHVLYKGSAENISDAQIKSQIDVLNNDFNGLNSDRINTPAAFKSLAGEARIRFCLAQVDPNGKKTSGIDRKYTSQDLFITDDGNENG
jgi:hypothetical protein